MQVSGIHVRRDRCPVLRKTNLGNESIMPNPLQVATKRISLPFLSMIMVLLFGLVGRALSQCSTPANAIVAENCLVGNPSSEWDVSTNDAGDPTIQGFATDISVNVGATVFFKINTPAAGYTINIYRMGYYGGRGARWVKTISPSVSLPQHQPACITDATVGLTDCGNWAVSASWQVPANATSGIYFAHLVRNDTGGDSHIIFIVRNDASHSAVLYQTSDETWQAYNYYGTGSFYSQGAPNFDLNNRSYKVSYNRPFMTRSFELESNTFVFGAEFPMVQWLEANGYDVTYFTGIDAARSGSLILNHKIYMDSGHDEYWSAPHRANVEAARDAGVNLAFFTANGVFWKTRWENSVDGTNTPNRTLVCYKETLAFQKIDPSGPSTWTGTWRDPTFSPPGDGGKPENALTGNLFMVNGVGPDNPGNLVMTVPASDGKMRFWRNTSVATLAPNAKHTTPTGTLGYEWDMDVDNGFRPAGAFHLSTSQYNMTTDLLLDYGATYGAGLATHHMMLYRAKSGALVFSAGTVNYSWALNSNHDNPFNNPDNPSGFTNPDPDPNMQQATVNLFADMGVQPATLQPGMVPATASTDTSLPTSTIVTPSNGSNITVGSVVTVSGTASDVGGVVAGVEFSGDGGATWHPAAGRANWSYAWTPNATGSITLMSRAVDDSGNLETPSGVTVNVAPQSCPCGLWGSSTVPSTIDSGDAGALEVGVKFRVDNDGSIIGLRFYKSAANTGTHIGHIWSSTGTLLGTATFTSESSSGWQRVNFTTPVPVSANTTYIASYFAPAGHYSSTSYFFEQSGVDVPPVHALASGVDGQNGVYTYGASGGFPISSFQASNYWVDIVYAASSTYSLSGTISGYGGSGATVSLSGTESLTTTADASGNFTFDGLVNGTYNVSASNPGVTFTPTSQTVTINGTAKTGVNFSAVPTNPRSISGTLTNGAGATVNLTGAATATVTADASGNYSFNGLLSGSYNVTPLVTGSIFTPYARSVTLSGSNASGVNFQGQSCNCLSIWQPSATPALIDSNDSTPTETGVKFKVDAAGYITGLRFYKASTNVGTHIGHIWSSSGALLGTATFTNESASGWQQVSFSSQIAVSPNTTYVASYLSPGGHYSADTNYFSASGAGSAPLHALQNGVDGPNGVYLYTSNGGFPTSTYASTNYWVDVVFTQGLSSNISGTVAGGAGATVALSGASTATAIADASGNYSFNGLYAGSYSITPILAGVAFSPVTQNVTVAGSNVAGVNFSTLQGCPCDTIWQPSTLPSIVDQGDSQSIELGVKFRAEGDGYILGVRFYKASTNTGVHVGNLWSNSTSQTGSGTLLATSNFANESASGWQQVIFANPVPVSGATTYIASYFAPAGHFSASPGFFGSSGVDSPPLHALANGVDGSNGVFSYSATSAYPGNSYNASNYWVDVIYAPTTTYTLGGVISGPGAAGATVTVSGPANKTATTDASGSYSISGLPSGTYTVTPTKAGYAFNPASQTVTISGSHRQNINFTSVLPYSISGTISGGSGESVALSGAATAITIADVAGNYTFPGLANGTYTVTPSINGFAVTPASQTVTVNGASATAINFNASVQAYQISGTITGGAGSTVILSGPVSLTTSADASGNYSFVSLGSGSYTVTPSAQGVVFVPASTTVVIGGTSVSGVDFTVPQNCPCDTLWQPSTKPVVTDVGDVQAVEVGVKFRADTDGYIAGIRFYKAAANTGTHWGNLWSSTGTLLGTATFSNESSSGWQQVLFAQPVPVAANQTYVASYFAPVGHYSADSGFFGGYGVDAVPLHGLANGVDGQNGLYGYSSVSAFPTSSYNAANYWVDVVYLPTSTYSITGAIGGAGGAGATVSLTGAATASTTADASGVFGFSGLSNGNYTLTPSSAGATYTPAVQNVTISNAHSLGVTFSSTRTYSITGTINGAGGPGATVSLTGAATATVTANASGAYTISGLANGSYTVTATKTGYVFSPTSQAVTINAANATANFSSALQTYTITGTISGAGGSGATVKLTGAATATVTADVSGVYTFTGVANGLYTVTPTKTGYVFSPPSQVVTINAANATVNFSSTVQTYTITGTISGAGGAGATVKLTGAATVTVTANASGVYTFTGLANGSYTVTPTKTGYVFSPANQAVTINAANATANFSSALQTYTITGTISGGGGASATVKLTGTATATVTANASGVYTFTGVANGSYTVTPTKTGHLFIPSSKTTTVNSANVTGVNFFSL
ncbi:MAG: hypothetical protein JWQ42_2491 [Edaphobacter sp.]|nr:hypothetical protein [Edaphobacter sp.]